MAHVAVVGSGNVGANTAFFIVETGVTDVLMYDIRAGVAAGKALDMMEAAPIRKYRNRITGVDSFDALAGAETVVIAAGSVRQPGMRREDLLEQNAPLVAELAPQIVRLMPEAVVLVATEPVDLMTTLFSRALGYPRHRVIGIGCCLDCTRLRHLVSSELGCSQENVVATIIGRHSPEMIVLPRYCTVSGVPVTHLLEERAISRITEQTRQAGDLIVELAQRSSAYYAPSAAAAELVDAVHMDLRRVICVSVVLDGELGVGGVALSLPAVVGRQGVERLLVPDLEPDEARRFTASADELERMLGGRAS